MKYSRPHHGRYHWFGLHASLWNELTALSATHMVLVMGKTGYAVVPMAVMGKYIADANTSPKDDGTIRHYHVLVTTGSKPTLFHHGKPARISLEPFFIPFPVKA